MKMAIMIIHAFRRCYCDVNVVPFVFTILGYRVVCSARSKGCMGEEGETDWEQDKEGKRDRWEKEERARDGEKGAEFMGERGDGGGGSGRWKRKGIMREIYRYVREI